MIIHDAPHGTWAWHIARLGIPTASQFHRIVTPGGKLAAGRVTYMRELLHEWRMGQPSDDLDGLPTIEYGRDMEPQARARYAVMTDIEPVTCGFVYKDESRMVGCSPDWLIPAPFREGQFAAGCEAKNPTGPTMVGYLLAGTMAVPKEHMVQVQASMWVTGFTSWEFFAHHPDYPSQLVTVPRDPEWMARFDEHIPAFIDELLEAREALMQRGVTPREPERSSAIEATGFDESVIEETL